MVGSRNHSEFWLPAGPVEASVPDPQPEASMLRFHKPSALVPAAGY
jgi:hypothetical protein